MRLSIIAFGKLRTPGLRETADYYKRIISPWTVLEEIELKPLQVQNKSQASRLEIQKKESELLLNYLSKLSPRRAVYLLTENGKTLNTQGWAKLIQRSQEDGLGDLIFCLGSSLGFGNQLKENYRETLSLGPQTLPHELARVVLFEQLYRAWSVVKGHPYHNEG